MKRLGLPSPALVHVGNTALSLVWSLLCFFPVSTYCTLDIHPLRLSLFCAVGLVVYAMPVSQMRYLELSARTGRYRRLGVPALNLIVQHGTVINRLLRREYPGYARFRSRTMLADLKRGTYVAERFHWALFLPFLLCSIHAIVKRRFGSTLLILCTNVLYNLYPIWLQQYLRLRLNRLRATQVRRMPLKITERSR